MHIASHHLQMHFPLCNKTSHTKDGNHHNRQGWFIFFAVQMCDKWSHLPVQMGVDNIPHKAIASDPS